MSCVKWTGAIFMATSLQIYPLMSLPSSPILVLMEESPILVLMEEGPPHTSDTLSIQKKGCIYGFWSSFNALNASWTHRWWYSTVHNVTAMIGAGVLSLPAAMVFLTWSPGIIILSVLWTLSLITLWQMIEMHEDKQGNRFDRYHELGQHVLGKHLGLWIIVPLQLFVEVGVDTVYVLTAAKSLRKISQMLHTASHVKVKHWALLFAFIQLFLSQFQQLTSITWISIIATFTAIGYSTIAWAATLYSGKSQRVSYDFPRVSMAASVFGIFDAMGQMAFATVGHNVVLEIQSTMPSTKEVPSKIAMWRGVLLSYMLIALCYYPCAAVGYWVYGNQQNENLDWVFGATQLEDNMLLALKGPSLLIVMANMMVVIHMFGGYQIYAMPLFDQIETFLYYKFRIEPNLKTRLLVRSIYVGFTCFLAVTFPFFADLQGFFGGFANVPSTFVLPGILWHIRHKPMLFSPPWIANMVSIIVGSILTITSGIGSIRNIIVKASTYRFYS